MSGMDMRTQARQCIKRAQELLTNGDLVSARYACLELRFAIEYIVYSQVECYKPELSDVDLKKWTPRDLINAMLEVDDTSDKSLIVTVTPADEVTGLPDDLLEYKGECRRFSGKWANKNHNTMGNFLHAPTIEQLEQGNTPTVEKIGEKLKPVIQMLERILNSDIVNLNFGDFLEFECRCGSQIKSREGRYKPEDGIKCPRCKAIWDKIERPDDSGKCDYHLRKTPIACPHCKMTSDFPRHEVEFGKGFQCPACKDHFGILYTVVRLDKNGNVQQPLEHSK